MKKNKLILGGVAGIVLIIIIIVVWVIIAKRTWFIWVILNFVCFKPMRISIVFILLTFFDNDW